MDEAQLFYRKMVNYFSNLPDDRKRDLLYTAVFDEKDNRIAKNLSAIIYELQLLDLKFIDNVLLNSDFESQKRAIQMLLYDKPFYNREDLTDLEKLKESIKHKFQELGTRTTKKQLLSTKEKDIWICRCGRSNDHVDESYCSECGNDIYGFNKDELSPNKAITAIDNKMELISHFIV